MTSELDESPDRPEGAPEAAGGDLKRAEHIEALGPPVYKDKTLWFRSDKVLARISAAEAEVARLREALKWYGERAKAITRHDKGSHYQEAVYTELALDKGKRARQALENSNG